MKIKSNMIVVIWRHWDIERIEFTYLSTYYVSNKIGTSKGLVHYNVSANSESMEVSWPLLPWNFA